jgi:hypothetical protein
VRQSVDEVHEYIQDILWRASRRSCWAVQLFACGAIQCRDLRFRSMHGVDELLGSCPKIVTPLSGGGIPPRAGSWDDNDRDSDVVCAAASSKSARLLFKARKRRSASSISSNPSKDFDDIRSTRACVANKST